MSWIVFLGSDANQLVNHLQLKLEDKIAGRMPIGVINGAPTPDEITYVSNLELSIPKAGEDLTEKEHSILRSLCRLSNVELLPFSIVSHRRFVGPVIVAAKRFIFRFLQVLLRDLVRQQRDFNVRAVDMISILSRRGGA